MFVFLFPLPHPPSIALGMKERCQEKSRSQEGLAPGASVLFHHSASGADLPDESERPGVWMWLSTLSMTKLGKKSPLGKEASMQMEKGHNGLEEIAVYKIASQRASAGILVLEKLKGRVRASSCWLGGSKPHPLAHRTVSKARQAGKNLPGEEFRRPAYSIPPLGLQNALQREREGEALRVPCA